MHFRLESKNLHEVREAYDITSLDSVFPDKHLPEFRQAISELVPKLCKLSHRLLRCLAKALGISPWTLTLTRLILWTKQNTFRLRWRIFYSVSYHDVPGQWQECHDVSNTLLSVPSWQCYQSRCRTMWKTLWLWHLYVTFPGRYRRIGSKSTCQNVRYLTRKLKTKNRCWVTDFLWRWMGSRYTNSGDGFSQCGRSVAVLDSWPLSCNGINSLKKFLTSVVKMERSLLDSSRASSRRRNSSAVGATIVSFFRSSG